MNPDSIAELIAVVGLILIPSIGLTARFALKPIIESMLKIREALDRQRPSAEDSRLAAIEARLAGVENAVERIAAVAEFDARLRAPVAAGVLPGARVADEPQPPDTAPTAARS